MEPEPRNRLARAGQLTAVALLCAVAILRLAFTPPGGWWRDWILILTAYIVYTVMGRNSRSWPLVTTSAMMFLLGIYIQGQIPHVLTILGWLP